MGTQIYLDFEIVTEDFVNNCLNDYAQFIRFHANLLPEIKLFLQFQGIVGYTIWKTIVGRKCHLKCRTSGYGTKVLRLTAILSSLVE